MERSDLIAFSGYLSFSLCRSHFRVDIFLACYSLMDTGEIEYWMPYRRGMLLLRPNGRARCTDVIKRNDTALPEIENTISKFHSRL